MYTVDFSFEDGGRVYRTQPMNADLTIAFMADANDQGFMVNAVAKLTRNPVL